MSSPSQSLTLSLVSLSLSLSHHFLTFLPFPLFLPFFFSFFPFTPFFHRHSLLLCRLCCLGAVLDLRLRGFLTWLSLLSPPSVAHRIASHQSPLSILSTRASFHFWLATYASSLVVARSLATVFCFQPRSFFDSVRRDYSLSTRFCLSSVIAQSTRVTATLGLYLDTPRSILIPCKIYCGCRCWSTVERIGNTALEDSRPSTPLVYRLVDPFR